MQFTFTKGMAAAFAMMAAGAFGLAAPQAVKAQNYPAKDITVIIPSPGGGPSDPLLRVMSDKFKQRTGAGLVMEYRPGGAFTVAAQALLRAPADGYTICSMSASLFSNFAQYNMPFKLEDFAPIMLWAEIPLMLTVPNSVPAKDLKEFIAYAKAKKDPINVAVVGQGPKMRWYQIAGITGFKFQDIPFKGTADSLQAVITGAVDGQFSTIDVSTGMSKQGRLKVLAIGSEKRLKAYPDIPTVAETVPGVVVGGWGSFIASSKVPRANINKVYTEFREIFRQPDIEQAVEKIGYIMNIKSPDELAELIRSDVVLYTRLAKEAGIVMQDIGN